MNTKFLSILSLAVAVMLLSVITTQAASITYHANLSGPRESPPNNSPGTGFVLAIFDPTTHIFDLHVTFSGLTGTTTAAHIHAPTDVPFTGVASVATQVPLFVGFPTGVTSGTYDNTFNTLDLSFYNPSFVTANGGTAAGAEAAFTAALDAHQAYFNIHTTSFPSGEIRGFLQVPDTGTTIGLLAMALVGLELLRRKVLPQLNA